jgi:glutamyl/glutaminyl-tRNA synthetase
MRAIEAVGDRLKRASQFSQYASYLYVDQVEPESQPWAELLAKPFAPARMKKLATALEDVAWEHDPIEKATRGVAASEEVKAGEVIMPARIALTGKKVSPGIFDVMMLLGKERTIERLRRAAERLEAESPAPTS